MKFSQFIDNEYDKDIGNLLKPQSCDIHLKILNYNEYWCSLCVTL